MLGTQNLLAFVVAGIILNLMPGPDTMYILGQSMSQGRRAGILSVLGIGSGVLCHVCAAAFGLSALLAASAVAFTVVKVIGAAYLIYLGIRTLLDKSSSASSHLSNDNTSSGWKIYGQGLLTNLLNPKIALFMMAFLPQFVRREAHLGAIPFLFLGSIFVFTSTVWGIITAFGAAAATSFIVHSQERAFRSVVKTGYGVFIRGFRAQFITR